MSAADDEKHREGEFYYPTENITLPSIVSDRNDVYLEASFACAREGWENSEGGYGRSV